MQLESLINVGIWVGFATYFALGIFFVYGWVRRLTGRVALAAAFITAGWFASLAVLGDRPTTQLLEVSAFAAWGLLVARVLGVSADRLLEPAYRTQSLLSGGMAAAYLAAAALIITTPSDWSVQADGAPPALAYLRLAIALGGLVMVEQMYRNTRRDYRWNLKYLAVGLGTLFGYAFVFNADQVLFRAFNPILFAPYGFIAAAAAPFIAIASLRNRNQRLNFSMSRRFVFGTGVLIIAGGYLLAMGVAGYYVSFFGGDWGEVFQILVVAAALIGLTVLAMSTALRNRVRVTLLRNLFEYKYDYRDEWLKVTRELTDPHPDDSLGQRAIHAVGDLVHASNGRYLSLSPQSVFVVDAVVRSAHPDALSQRASRSLIDFWRGRDWIIDLDEYRRDRSRYPGLDIDADESTLAADRFIVPLIIDEAITGIIILGQPQVPINLIWEDYDILKVAARQAAGFLALKAADDALATADQFRAMDQLSAFVVHDLKTISAQLGLLVKNAEKHATKPEFVADMIKTTDHAVARMNRLLDQLRNRGVEQPSAERLRLADIASSAVARHAERLPRPSLSATCGDALICADRDRIVSAIGNIIENAQQACRGDGRVNVDARVDGNWAIISVRDTGAGMSSDFIDQQLFAPFSTTKGISGIGIGAFQTRAYVRSIGGDLAVRSAPGHGSEFTVRLPRADVT